MVDTNVYEHASYKTQRLNLKIKKLTKLSCLKQVAQRWAVSSVRILFTTSHATNPIQSGIALLMGIYRYCFVRANTQVPYILVIFLVVVSNLLSA